MIAVTRDLAWDRRLQALSFRGGWTFESCRDLASMGKASRERALIIVDGALFAGSHVRGVAGLRALYAPAAVVLALTEEEMSPESMKAALASGADEVLGKEWAEKKIFARA